MIMYLCCVYQLNWGSLALRYGLMQLSKNHTIVSACFSTSKVLMWDTASTFKCLKCLTANTLNVLKCWRTYYCCLLFILISIYFEGLREPGQMHFIAFDYIVLFNVYETKPNLAYFFVCFTVCLGFQTAISLHLLPYGMKMNYAQNAWYATTAW